MLTPDLVVELYAGAGGLSEGLGMLGLRTVGLELAHDPCVTAVRAGHLRVRCDVATYPTAPFAGRVQGVVGSPPCTSFSSAGSGAGRQVLHILLRALDELAAGKATRARRRKECQRVMASWARHRFPRMTRAERAAWSWEQACSAVQVLEPLRFVRDLRPEWVVLEQVRAVLPIWRHYVRILRGWGYSAWTGILNSADFGVPQTRERAILIASRVRAAVPPEPTHAREPVADLFGTRQRWVSTADALGWDGIDRPARTVCGDRGPRWAYGEGASSYATGWTLHSRRDGPGWVEGHGDRDNRELAEPAPTVTGEAGRWELKSGQRSERAAGMAEQTRDIDEPSLTVTGKASQWVVDRRTNSRGPQGSSVPVAPVSVDRPAPTLTGLSGRQWVLRSPHHAKTNDRTRTLDDPAHTVAFGRITIVEAAILQSFRPDYPWCGNKTAQFLSVGNAFPPRLAAAVCGAATGRDWRTAVEAYYSPGDVREVA